MHPLALPHNATKATLYIILSFLLLSVSVDIAVCSQNVTSSTPVLFFYEEGCLKCQQALPVIEDITNTYGNNFTSHEIISSFGLARMYGISVVPAVVVNNSIIITYYDYQGNLTLLRELLTIAIARSENQTINMSEHNLSKISTDNNVTISTNNRDKINGLSPYLVFLAGLFAGFNPCILAVMAFLATLILSSSEGHKGIFKMISGFCTGIFFTYMLVGLSILGTIQMLPSLKSIITTTMVVLIFILGCWQIYDAYHLKKKSRSTFQTPKALIKLLEKTSKGNIFLLSFVSGGIFSLVKAPCVGGIYFSIL
ncbi:MAG: hypothetical protein H5T43_08510, partial [Methanomethylovorans sp.]|nr:hypothetical protein [Methanomethylovorans sp.]